jgi:hypothetical protein
VSCPQSRHKAQGRRGPRGPGWCSVLPEPFHPSLRAVHGSRPECTSRSPASCQCVLLLLSWRRQSPGKMGSLKSSCGIMKLLPDHWPPDLEPFSVAGLSAIALSGTFPVSGIDFTADHGAAFAGPFRPLAEGCFSFLPGFYGV